MNKLVITELYTPITTGIAFSMVVSLQDQYNQPAVATEDMDVKIFFANGGLELVGATSSDDFVIAQIPVGKSEIRIQLQVDAKKTPSSSPFAQLEVRVIDPEEQVLN